MQSLDLKIKNPHHPKVCCYVYAEGLTISVIKKSQLWLESQTSWRISENKCSTHPKMSLNLICCFAPALPLYIPPSFWPFILFPIKIGTQLRNPHFFQNQTARIKSWQRYLSAWAKLHFVHKHSTFENMTKWAYLKHTAEQKGKRKEPGRKSVFPVAQNFVSSCSCWACWDPALSHA